MNLKHRWLSKNNDLSGYEAGEIPMAPLKELGYKDSEELAAALVTALAPHIQNFRENLLRTQKLYTLTLTIEELIGIKGVTWHTYFKVKRYLEEKDWNASAYNEVHGIIRRIDITIK